ncbi:Cytochrome P450 98A1 [Lasiodiplodia theobromae]|uniref:Cytochrome P450 98A1 n=1 Tax=Lasiodiplodia theobromae TaxID=45133 RepID=A0A5N5D0A2_9PEZI|nr:Cytochrome P450 98A1 [Lasiodiplodia theobromae]
MDITKKLLGATFLPMIQGYADSSSSVDMLTMTYALCLDWVDSFVFGYSSINKLLRPDGNDVNIFLKYYEERYSKEAFWLQELPALSKLVTKLGFSIIPKEGKEATRWLEDWLQQMCDRADAAIEKGDLLDAANVPIVYQQVKQAVNRDCSDDSETTRKRKIASELFDHMSSAREVLGLVLGYAIFYLSGKPEVQSKLREELLGLSSPITAGTSESQLPTPSSLDDLPYLDAVIKESLRMRPTSTPLPRVTPTDKAVTLGGFENIPPGTRVNTFQWFVHRDPRAWSNVDEWIPERWLSGNDGSDSGVLWPFVTGSRMCLGSHLAGYSMKSPDR